ncbi:MAG: hypothetical protein ABIW38_06105 [Ferruginibacter sp.]
MKNKFRYNTVTSAIDALRREGFINDFNLIEDRIVCGEKALQVDDVDIKILYRYEGDSDPADEATVYGLESKEGLKGILVLGDETDSDETSTKILTKLHLKNNRSKKLH